MIKLNVYLVSTKGLRADWAEPLTSDNCPRNGEYVLLSAEEYANLKKSKKASKEKPKAYKFDKIRKVGRKDG